MHIIGTSFMLSVLNFYLHKLHVLLTIQVANAVGAALGMIAGYSDSVESLSQAMDKVKAELQDKPENEIREEAQRRLVKECMDKAVANARLKGTVHVLVNTPV